MKSTRIVPIIVLGLAPFGPIGVSGQTKSDVVSRSELPTLLVHLTDEDITWLPLHQLLFVSSTTPLIVSPATVGGRIEGALVVSSHAVSASTEPVAADHAQATDCNDWQNWRILRYWGIWSEYKHSDYHDGPKLLPHNWRHHSVVRRKGPPHYWNEDGLARRSHEPCEEGIG